MKWLGLDIGGANLKVAWDDQASVSISCPLWKNNLLLGSELANIFSNVPSDQGVAVTMTGEIADCFATRSEGVAFIVNMTTRYAFGRPVLFYNTDGGWFDSNQAIHHWKKTAASNWHAIAQQSGSLPDFENGFLVDMGSTTTDIIPIRKGHPASHGKTDIERLAHRELVYLGMQRTPIPFFCERLFVEGRSTPIVAELFATIHDGLLLTGEVDENVDDCDTADGRSATRDRAAQRIARLVCDDADALGERTIFQMAAEVKGAFRQRLSDAIRTVVAAHPDLPRHFVLSGQGEGVVARLLDDLFPDAVHRGWSGVYGKDASRHAGAFSVRALAAQAFPHTVHPAASPTLSSPKGHGVFQLPPPVNRRRPIRVVKIGGSLLEWTPARERIEDWLKAQKPMPTLWIVGGGPFVDWLRHHDERFKLAEPVAHDMCIDLMSVTHRLVGSWFPDWKQTDAIDTWEPFNESSSSSSTCCPSPSNDNTLFDVAAWIRQRKGVPKTWELTSDSIAALLADQLAAEEVVLLKSCPPPADLASSEGAGETGCEPVVDPLFANACRRLVRVRIVNLRDDLFTESVWHPGHPGGLLKS